jgi:hypothetical protein
MASPLVLKNIVKMRFIRNEISLLVDLTQLNAMTNCYGN